MSTIVQDVRYGLRLFAASPAFTIVAVLSLAIGIGVNSAVFSVAEAALLRSWPAASPERLVKIVATTPQGTEREFSYPDYQDLTEGNQTLDGVLAYARHGKFVRVGNEPRMVLDDIVSPNYFAVLGIAAARGRTFSAADAAGRVAVISDVIWRRLFNADPSLVGRPIVLNGVSYTVLGIAPPGFRGLQRGVPTDLWIPLDSELRPAELRDRGHRDFELLARLRDGATASAARAELDTIGRRLAEVYPATDHARAITLESEDDRVRKAAIPALLLMAAVGLVLLICCANVAGLVLARSEARRREIAVRLAVGARPARLVRQLLTESAMLASGGAALGLVFASWLMRLQPALLPPVGIEIGLDLRLDRSVLIFTLAASAVAVIVFGLAPALKAGRFNLVTSLKADAAAGGGLVRRLSLRNAFVLAEIALSVVLVTASLSLVRSFAYSRGIDLGMDLARPLVFFDLAPGVGRYTNQRSLAFFEQAAERARAVPGAVRATFARRLPLSPSGGGASKRVTIPGILLPDNRPNVTIKFDAVAPDYFETVRTPLLRGRVFATGDNESAARVAIVSDAMARRFWQQQDPIGRVINADGRDCRIVGIVADAKINDIHESPEPYMYLPFAQAPSGEGTLIVEAARDPSDVISAIRGALQDLDVNVPIVAIRTTADVRHGAFWQDSIAAGFVGTLGALGLLLAGIGLYTVIAYAVNRRRHEIGIRLALGAARADVLRLVFASGLGLAAIGTAAGLVISLGTTRLISSALYGITAADPLAFGSSAAIVMAIAAVATYVPARRAVRVDPMTALRCE